MSSPSQRQKIEHDKIIRLERELTEKFEGIRGQLKNLDGTIDQLSMHWRGAGAGAFQAKQTEINMSVVKIGNILVKFIEGLSATRKINDGTEDVVRAEVHKIAVESNLNGL